MKKIRKKRKKWDSVEIVSFILLTLLAILIVVPFWNAIVISFETNAAYMRHPFSWLPGEFTLDNYKKIFERGDGLIMAYKNTIFLTLVGTLLAIVIESLAGYAFSRTFPGRRPLFLIMLFTMYFGGGLIPTYLLIRNLHLINTFAGIILLSLASTYNIIVMKNSFQGTPIELQDAAMIDGANDMQMLFRVMLPLQKPMLATFTLFTAVGYWNNWYWPMLIINNGEKTVLQVFLRMLIQTASQVTSTSMQASLGQEEAVTYALGIQMAAVFIVILPIMLVYPFLQKYFAKGMLVGSVKA